MTKASSSKTKTTEKKTTTAKTTAAKRTAPRKAAPKKRAAASSTAAQKSAATARKAPAKKAAAKPAAKKAATKKAAPKAAAKPATKTAKKAAPKPAAKTAAKPAKPAAKKAAPKTASKPSPKPQKTTEKVSVKAAAKVPAPKSAKTPEAPSEDDDKPKIAPAPMRPALRVQKRAEARRDKNQTFKVNTQIIYPAHGVGHIAAIEKQSIADIEVELFVIDFEHEKMKLRVPVNKAAASGMRNLSTVKQIDEVLTLLEGKARVKRTMWSRRAQEYEAKINSGDLQSVGEVVRDLYRGEDQPEQSYSERQLFEQARERLGREVAAVRKKSLEKAVDEIQSHLAKKAPVDAG